MTSALRPRTTPGLPLATLAARIGAVPARIDPGSAQIDSGSARIDPGSADATDVSDVRICGVTLRAQDAVAGDLFAALPGATVHGAVHTAVAVEAGAVAVLTDADGVAVIRRLLGADSPSVPVVVHPAPRSVLGALSADVYGHPSDRVAVLGVTGTSGKTTTAYLI